MRTLAIATTLFAIALPYTAPAPRLASDDTMARVHDRQGMAFFRPLASERWTPVDRRTRLRVGDSLRTSARGANAVEVGLRGGEKLVAGPGTLLRLVDENTIEVVSGDLEVSPAEVGPGAANPGKKKSELTLRGIGNFERQLDRKLILRAGAGKTEVLDQAPRWLEGYRASATSEWLGSLVAKVDGRDVSLTLGSIKISVEIRDQIARTTIEEAFVNNTPQTLEGDFRFPLPADASISGFGMWIGDELVEADIVEKQRARAIYEQILREKRDPGLLEWSGGNLFKARVFPIFPHSQKRIRIRYTQVLPLEGRTIRYSYPLRSEMLAKTPLKELVVDTKIWSTTKISKVESPTHAMQTSSDGETASARFEAQDYSPSGDFELRMQLAEVPPLRVVAHQRGNDGYFMALLNAPRGEGQAPVTTTPEGKAIEVVVVADVSGSMTRATRIGQHRFIEGLLNLLGPADRFRIVTADADVRAYQETAIAATPTQITDAMKWLDSRISLGWTDLDATFEAVTQLITTRKDDRDPIVVYVGDGIHTAGDGDTAALAARLRARHAKTPASFHAVAPSSSYETAVLESLAQLGNGTMRVLDASDPSGTAAALLNEARSPAIEDLEIRFEGLQTARVYPVTLRRLPEGMQHTILGRYLPGPTARSGRVIVTGKQAGSTVRFEQAVHLAADKGQSFVPRLWARRHIDQLLAEGGEQSKANVVALSSEFGIMTPYTSFLVLENDEDRERFGVERSVHMRDGEDFFAAARDRATETLLREQLAKARGWRLDLQRHMYRELSGLGRDLHVALAEQVGSHDLSIVDALGAPQLSKTVWGNSIVTETRGSRSQLGRVRLSESQFDSAEMAPSSAAYEVEEVEAAVSGSRDKALGLDFDSEQDDELESNAPAETSNEAVRQINERSLRLRRDFVPPAMGGGGFGYLQDRQLHGPASPGPGRRQVTAKPTLATLGFPSMAPVPTEEPELNVKIEDEVTRRVLAALDRRDSLLSAAAGARFRVLEETIHAVRKATTSKRTTEALWSSDGWLTRTRSGLSEPHEAWFANGEVGNLLLGRLLGRKRKAVDADRRAFQLPLMDWSFSDPERTYAQAVFERRGVPNDLALWVLEIRPRDGSVSRSEERRMLRVTIDHVRACILEIQDFLGERKVQTLRFSDFVTALGSEWATRTEVFDEDQRLVRRISLQIDELSADAAKAEVAEARQRDAKAIYAPARDPGIDDAKEAHAKGSATAVDELFLAAHHGSKQLWEQMLASIATARRLDDAPLAFDLLKMRVLQQARKGEAFVRAIDDLVQRAATHDGATRAWFTNEIWTLAAPRFSAEEKLRLLTSLRPAIGRPSEDAALLAVYWGKIEASIHQQLGDDVRCESLLRTLRAEHPFDIEVMTLHFASLLRLGRNDEVVRGWIDATRGTMWDDGEVEAVNVRCTDLLWSQRKYAELDSVLAAWTSRAQASQQAWSRWLSMQLFADRVDAADSWASERLATLPERLDEVVRSKVSVAIAHAFTTGWNYSSNRLTPEWSKRLYAAATQLLDRGESALVRQIISPWQWRQRSDVAAMLRARMLELLVDGERITVMPIDVLTLCLQNVEVGKGQLDPAQFTKIHDGLRSRWQGLVAKGRVAFEERTQVAQHLLSICDARVEKEAAYSFAKERFEASSIATGNRRTCAVDLFERTLALDEVQRVEDNAKILLPEVVAGVNDAEARLAIEGSSVRELCESLYRLQYERALGSEEERKSWSRAELRARQAVARSTARSKLARWLVETLREGNVNAWARLEAAGYEAQQDATHEGLADALARAVETGKQVYGHGLAFRAAYVAENPHSPDTGASRVLRERAAMLVAFAGVKRGTRAATTETARAWLLATLPQDADAPRDADALQDPSTLDGRYHIARFLLVLGRINELEALLATWVAADEVASRWRILAGYLAAERSELREAIALFERVLALDELEPTELARLGDWKLVVGDREARQLVHEAMAMATPIDQLRAQIWAEGNRVSRINSGPAPELDPLVLVKARALFAKTPLPGNEIYVLRNLYRSTKDHRVLEALPKGVVGHTQQAVYALLGQLSIILGEVHEEATCDRLDEELMRSLETAKEKLDQRGLHMMRVLVLGRAAELRNQPGPHSERALASLKASFDRAHFAPGEDLQRAKFLELMSVGDGAILDERLRQLEDLYQHAEEGSSTQVGLAQSWFSVLGPTEASKARDVLSAAIEANIAKNGGRLVTSTRNAWQQLESAWIAARDFGRPERMLLRLRDEETQAGARFYLDRRTSHVRIEALRHGGTVSLGSGLELHDKLATMLENELDACTAYEFTQVLDDRMALALAGHARHLDQAVRAFNGFANKVLPGLVAKTPELAQLYQVSQTIAKISGGRAALAYSIARHGDQPTFWRRLGRDVWTQIGYRMAQWRHEEASIASLEAPLLALACFELEDDLTMLSNRTNAMWWRGNRYFWAQRRSDFERVAKKVLELQEDSPARIAYVASYLWNGLASYDVAIEALLAAEARGTLQESTLRTLAGWCMSTEGKRPSVTLRIVEAFLEDDPLRLEDRLLRAKALMSLGRADEARSELIATEHLLREGNRWTESNVAALAQAAMSDVPALDLAVRYFKEAIAMRDKALGGVARPDWTISFYYAELTKAHVGQQQWAEAFAAARSALVTADARHNRKAKADEAMNLLLRVGPLREIIAMHDQEVARSGQDAALLRKLFGSALLRQRVLDEAIVQLRKATELQPDDPATWDSLVAAHDQNKEPDAALEVLRQSLDVLPFDLERTTAYATRLEHAKQHELAMRAWTQLVELRPDEAVSHERLAASFERHLEWPSALQQWRRVTDIRPEEPKSWFGLADAQARSGANDDARATLRTMMAKDWEARFGDVKAEVERRLGSLRG